MRRRLFQPTLVAGHERLEGGRCALTAPAVGLWRSAPEPGRVLAPGMSLGELEVLGAIHRIEVPPGAHGRVSTERPANGRARVPVAFGDVLLVLEPGDDPATRAAGSDAPGEAGVTAPAPRGELTFRAPSSGRFFGRPAPDRAPFVSVGDILAPGQTVCLLEVMKTFNRVLYAGAGLPERARVLRVVPSEQADLNAGDPILELESAG